MPFKQVVIASRKSRINLIKRFFLVNPLLKLPYVGIVITLLIRIKIHAYLAP